ncbi:flagellar biosynthesis protein FlhB [Anaerobium acetethylicum]|uniref:Flagellar biosynthetic protein FlhB n=1 Tax=Anaerobium acetethylicum TaxID=1619234 RepID=A0A1D3TQP4_9FIRM|nr:flagellar biosynthesis protein FlhB [Anaerobium acetethylicum]SCP95915.1 flagellar biosynthetic protein FlhB [Anaerobium acetethylicum]
MEMRNMHRDEMPKNLLRYNLQYFAADGGGGEKTEPASAKKMTDAREEGQVAKSKELGSALALIALFMILKYFGGSMAQDFLDVFRSIYGKIPELAGGSGTLTVKGAGALMNLMALKILAILAPVLIIATATAIAADIVQVGWKVTSKPMMPKLSKINPISGFKRMFSVQSLAELVKSILKIGVISYVAYDTLKDQMGFMFILYDMPLPTAIGMVCDMVISLGLKISFIYLIIGFGDYAFQKFKLKKDLKMTKQEVRDEYKNSEGNPEIKGKIKSRMREASQKRMMKAVPTADVVITNPTHFAVAIKYDTEASKAPVVIAKGEDYLAMKIKETAKENKIEIVENKPLARMLYHNVDVDAEIPPELYQAVAEVLAYVYSLKKQ